MAEDLTREAQKIWNALRVMVDKEIDKRTASCVRSRKMTVMAAPNGSTIGVAEPFGETVYIPYSSTLANAKVGDSVWVDWKFNNASTMVAMATGEGQIVPDYMEINEPNRNLLEARKFIQSGLTSEGDLETPTADTVPMDYVGIGSSNYYIHVKPSTNYRLTLFDTRIETESASCVVAQYASNGTFISLAASGIGWREPQGMTFVTNVNAAFLRLSLVGFPKYRWKLEEGEISTDWQPAPEDASPYTFDTVPTNGSVNPVTSDGVYDALATKQGTLTFDATPTDGSSNPVTSDGIYAALSDKVSKSGDTMTGTLLAPTMKVYDASYPMFVLQSSASDTSALGAVYENIANRQLVFRQRSTAGYVEDYYLPVNSATSANASYEVITGKGGTMTGNLNIRNGYFVRTISPTIDTTASPSETLTQDGLVISDKNINTIGYISAYQKTNGNVGLQIQAARPYNGGYALNAIALEVDSNGTLDVGVSAPMQWRKALNGQEIKVRSGTTVISPSANSTAETVITNAQLATMFGISGSSPSNTTVVMSNGDQVANNVGVTSAYNSNVQGWKALFASPISTPIRINWIAVYYGT